MLKKIASHLRVGADHLERVDDALRTAAAAEIAEVGRTAAGQRDQIEGRHDQPGAVPEHADLPVELDVGDALLARGALLDRHRLGVAHRRDILVAKERVVVDRDLGVQCEKLAGLGHDQRVDLAESRVAGGKNLV